jgi:hypothetical protein
MAARDLYRQIADAHGRSAAYGAEHSATLLARHQLALYTGQAGDAAGARDLFAALPVSERVIGPEHPYTLATRHMLATYTGEAGMRPGRGTCSPRCCPSRSGCKARSTRTPWPPANSSPIGRKELRREEPDVAAINV